MEKKSQRCCRRRGAKIRNPDWTNRPPHCNHKKKEKPMQKPVRRRERKHSPKQVSFQEMLEKDGERLCCRRGGSEAREPHRNKPLPTARIKKYRTQARTAHKKGSKIYLQKRKQDSVQALPVKDRARENKRATPTHIHISNSGVETTHRVLMCLLVAIAEIP